MWPAQSSGMRTLGVALLSSVFCLVAAQAHADEGVAPARAVKVDKVSATETSWYGHQTLFADFGVGAGTTFAIAASPSGVLVAPAFALAAPTVHLAHGRYGAAGASFALRTLVPLTGGLIARGSCDPSDRYHVDSCRWNAALTGAFIGVGIASILDATLLSWETKPAEAKATASITPTASVSSQGMSLGLSGTF